jgi:type II secretory pathway pseudopilin PulG
LGEGCVVKTLIVVLLVLGIFTSAVLAQSAEQVRRERQRVLCGWLRTVRAAESKYKVEHGVYGDLTALRRAHLLDSLVFESDEPTESLPDTNLVPENTHFEVTASSDGKHYQVWISEEITEELSIGVYGNEISEGASIGRVHRPPETWDATPT